MNTQLVKASPAEVMETVLVKGDLSKLTVEERSAYYKAVCDSVGLNALTKPFEYILLNGKLTLYALKGATDQLRSLYDISVTDLTKETIEGVHIVTAKVTNAKGRTDADIGAVNIAGLKGEAFANAVMKASTKAKRRATLSICGLGMLDETEVEDIPAAQKSVPRVPSPSEVEKVEWPSKRIEPYAVVPNAGDTFLIWKDRYFAGIDTAESVADLDQWAKLNEHPLSLISTKAPDLHKRIRKAADEIKARLQRDSISTGPIEQKMPSAYGLPDIDTDYDGYIKAALKLIADSTDGGALETFFNGEIASREAVLFPPDFTDICDAYDKRQAQLKEADQ